MPEKTVKLREITRNSHVIDVISATQKIEQSVLVIPDVHWDNPKCDRELLMKHLNEARRIGARIILPGDTFCLMQGAYDPRKNKGSIRQEHNVDDYLDAVITTAAEWFAPWQDLIDVVGIGNHESSILKRQETNVIERFVQALNARAKGKHRVMSGGYTGWYTLAFHSRECRKSYRIKYMHGWGGGGPVTHGAIDFNRMAAITENADSIVMGHIHRVQTTVYSRESIDNTGKPFMREVHFIRCGSYKDDYDDGHHGWHVERGMGPRAMGGYFLHVYFDRGRSTNGGKCKAIPVSVTSRAVRC